MYVEIKELIPPWATSKQAVSRRDSAILTSDLTHFTSRILEASFKCEKFAHVFGLSFGMSREEETTP